MLGKLLKYDLKAINKYFLPMSIFILIYSLIGTFVFKIDEIPYYTNGRRIIIGFIIIAFFLMIIAYNIISQVIVVVNFYKSMVTDTGYLSHTLPVKKRTLILSKTIASLIALFSCLIVILGCVTIFLDVPRFYSHMYPEIADFFTRLSELCGTGTLVVTLITFIIFLIVSYLFSISLYFVSIAFGQLINRHKIIGSIVSYFVLVFIIQIVSTIMSVCIPSVNIVITCLDDIGKLNTNIAPLFFGGFSCILAVAAVGFLCLTNWIFSKKLNLD